MTTNFVSSKVILDKLYRDLKINNELPVDDVIEWIGEALLMIGAFGQFEVETEALEIVNHKAQLPCNFYKLAEISHKGQPMMWAGQSMTTQYLCDDCKVSTCQDCDTFYINDSYLITSIESASKENRDLCITYLALPIDEDGFPKIPDDVYYIKACTAYVTYMLDFQEWRKGRQTDKVFNYSEKEWNWYVGSARGAANMPNLQQMENYKNILGRLIPLQNEYRNFFRNNGKQERKLIQ
jgi:hypothetical protein